MRDKNLQPLANPVNQFCTRAGISRTTFYDEVAAGEIKVIKIKSRTLVTEAEAQRYFAKKTAEAENEAS